MNTAKPVVITSKRIAFKDYLNHHPRARNGWGPGARLRAPVGVQGQKPPAKILGFIQF